MFEIDKFGEANFFLKKMQEEKDDPTSLGYYFSAFMSAARSIIQYIYETVKNTNNLSWYEKRTTETKTFGFFKEKRDQDIHKEPVKPVKEYTQEQPRVPEWFIATTYLLPIEIDPSIEPPTLKEIIRIDGWKGVEDLFSLCNQYLGEIALFVKEAIIKGVIKKT